MPRLGTFVNLRLMKIKILVISLERSVDRRDTISRRLKELKLEFTFVDAVDATTLPQNLVMTIQQQQRQIHDYGRNVGQTEIACAMSHIKAYQMISDQGLDGAIILEDDAIIESRFASLFRWLTAETKPVEGMWLLGGGEYLEKQVVKTYFDFAILSTKPHYRDLSWGQSFKIIGCFDRLARACGYFLDKGTAVRLAAGNNPIQAVADDWPFFIKNGWVTPYLCRPYLISHPLELSGQSLLQSERTNPRDTSQKKKLSSRIKEQTGYYRVLYRLKVILHQGHHRLKGH